MNLTNTKIYLANTLQLKIREKYKMAKIPQLFLVFWLKIPHFPLFWVKFPDFFQSAQNFQTFPDWKMFSHFQAHCRWSERQNFKTYPLILLAETVKCC